MSPKFIALSLFAGLGVSCPQTDAGEARPPYRFLRYDEDYRFLSDPAKRIDLWDWIKYIPLDGAGFLSFGGEARERFETYQHENFSTNPKADNAYLLQRYLFHLDYHPAGWLPFSRNCRVRSKTVAPADHRRADHGRRTAMPSIRTNCLSTWWLR